MSSGGLKQPWGKLYDMAVALDSALRLQWCSEHPDHEWIGPSVIELMLLERERLAKERDELKDEGRKLLILLDRKEFTIQNTFNHWQTARDEVDALKAENEYLQRQLADERSGACDDSLAKHLRWENEKLRAALEFYADRKNWKSVTIEDTNRRFCIFTGADLEYFEHEDQNSYCGKRARQALEGEK